MARRIREILPVLHLTNHTHHSGTKKESVWVKQTGSHSRRINIEILQLSVPVNIARVPRASLGKDLFCKSRGRSSRLSAPRSPLAGFQSKRAPMRMLSISLLSTRRVSVRIPHSHVCETCSRAPAQAGALLKSPCLASCDPSAPPIGLAQDRKASLSFRRPCRSSIASQTARSHRTGFLRGRRVEGECLAASATIDCTCR